MNDDTNSPSPVRTRSYLRIAAWVAGLVVLLYVLAVFVLSNHFWHAMPCEHHLSVIHYATEAWARDHQKSNSDVPTDSDLFGPGKYILEKPRCPEGGVYTLSCVTNRPKCSIPNHND